MGWKQCSLPKGLSAGIELDLEKIFMAAGAPVDWALFVRDDEAGSSEILLLTPSWVDALGSSLPRTWSGAPDPTPFGWSLLLGHSDAMERFGLSYQKPGE